MKIKTLLHEQNVRPGLANRCLSRVADSVAVSFPASRVYFPESKIWVSGLPVRADIASGSSVTARRQFGLLPQVPTFLVFGGSLGARGLNSAVVKAWPLLQSQGLKFQVLHVSGEKDFERVEELYRALDIPAKVLAYCHDMPQAYAAADAVVCRAGASTVAELLVVKRPALLVPYPYATNNHQVYNAQMIERLGLGQMVLEADLQPSVVAGFCAKSVADDSFKLSYIHAAQSVPSDVNPCDASTRLAHHLIVG